MKNKRILFVNALSIAMNIVKKRKGISEKIIFVRDLRGRIRLLLPGSSETYSNRVADLKSLRKTLNNSLGAYGFAPESMIIFNDDLAIDSSAIQKDCLYIEKANSMDLYLLDRQISGQDWLRDTFARQTKNPRVTFFGIKGGVGRSTTLIIWAWNLARQGKKVLIFDLDLESPGVSSTLLPQNAQPDFGIVDWFVEDGVGQAEAVEREMLGVSPLAAGLSGEIRIVPAFGKKTEEYLPKLARCYADEPGMLPASWSTRLERLVTVFEKSENPDVVILDSRAGIHDIAAAAVTRMGAASFLFAVDSHQTWNAYSFLFRHWKNHPNLKSFRDRLQVVAAMIPETGREEYLWRFREHSWDLFRDHLYDEAGPDTPEAFTFDLAEDGAPHDPLPVFWHRALQEFDPVRAGSGMEHRIAAEALGDFMDRAGSLFATD